MAKSRQIVMKRWETYKKWQRRNSDKIQPEMILTREQYIRKYNALKKEGYKNINEELKDQAQFLTRRETFRSIKAFYDEANPEREKLSWKLRRSMTTTELADKIKDQIKDFYKKAREDGRTANQTKIWVSEYFFGS